MPGKLCSVCGRMIPLERLSVPPRAARQGGEDTPANPPPQRLRRRRELAQRGDPTIGDTLQPENSPPAPAPTPSVSVVDDPERLRVWYERLDRQYRNMCKNREAYLEFDIQKVGDTRVRALRAWKAAKARPR